jgi:MFS family permease
VAARGLLAGAFFGAEAFVPLMLDDQRGFSVTMAGVALTASALGWFTGSWWQGRPSLNADRDRLVVIGALLILAGILGMAAAVVAPLPFLVALLAWTVGGLGMGITIPSVNVRVLSLSPKSEQGANSAALQAIDGVGVIICTSLAGAIYASATQPVGDQASTFITLFLAMTVFAVVAVVAARRLHVGAGDVSDANTPEAVADVIDDVSSPTPPPALG